MELNRNNGMPRHVGIIMDGNGRWAKKRLMPRSYGHRAGMERMISLAEHAKELNIRYLTVYALSTENLSRPQEELEGLYSLFRKYFTQNVKKLKDGGAGVKVIGDVTALPEDIQALIADSQSDDNGEPSFTFVIALNYGSRTEILSAVNKAVARAVNKAKNGEEVGALTRDEFEADLQTAGLPDPDLIIRTGGEKRLSNFLMYQAAYAELYFSDVLFPDFDNDEFDKAIEDFSHRTRRFGKV
jgi:undecaprenyl diphosphate synthase